MKTKLKEKIKIKAVHDDDLTSFLLKLGLLEDIKNSRLKCSFCDCVITLDNFGGVYKEKTELKPFCKKPVCYLEVLKRKSEVKQGS